jgi:hypothetical protein
VPLSFSTFGPCSRQPPAPIYLPFPLTHPSTLSPYLPISVYYPPVYLTTQPTPQLIPHPAGHRLSHSPTHPHLCPLLNCFLQDTSSHTAQVRVCRWQSSRTECLRVSSGGPAPPPPPPMPEDGPPTKDPPAPPAPPGDDGIPDWFIEDPSEWGNNNNNQEGAQNDAEESQ